MDVTKMTLLTWHEGSEPAPEGTIALLQMKEYELFDFQDYEKDGTVIHFPSQQLTGFGISHGNGRWEYVIIDSEKTISEGDHTFPEEFGKILRWAAVPFGTAEDCMEELEGEDAIEAFEKTKNIPFGEDGKTKFIRDDM